MPRRIEFTAGRFALKEALIKAFHGQRKAESFEIGTNKWGEPYVKDEKFNIFCSVSHEKEFALAFVIVEL